MTVIHSLAKGMNWKGDIITGEQALCIEGTVDGNIMSNGEVSIAPSGLVRGTIQAVRLIVNGRVEGTLRISESLEIRNQGFVIGEAGWGTLIVDEGATLQGKSHKFNPTESLETSAPEGASAKAPRDLDAGATRQGNGHHLGATRSLEPATPEGASAKAPRDLDAGATRQGNGHHLGATRSLEPAALDFGLAKVPDNTGDRRPARQADPILDRPEFRTHPAIMPPWMQGAKETAGLVRSSRN